MDISPYITELLESKDQVIVPGLGKLYQKKTAGYYHEETKTFYPPAKEIDFTIEYHHDDKLVQLISERNNITLTSAYTNLDEYVKDIKTILKNSKAQVNGIGSLTIEDEKIILDVHFRSFNSEDYFGLPPIDTQAGNLTGEDAEDYSLAQQALNTAMPDDYESEKADKASFRIIILLIIALMLGSIIAVYYLYPAFYQKIKDTIQQKTEFSKPAVIDKNPNSQALQKADSVYEDQDIEANLKAKGFEVEKVKDSTAVSIKQKLIPKKTDIRYEVIIGLYLKRGDAIKRVSQLKANGINAYIVEDADGPMTKISGATFYSEQEAQKELKRIREQLNPEAFIKPIKSLK